VDKPVAVAQTLKYAEELRFPHTATLGVGDETVKAVLARIFAKLGVGRRAEAVATAYDRGLL
jgi:hypothetical protein